MIRPSLCARPGCGAPATAVLTFQYATRTVWLLDQGDPDPAAIDLCARHADRTHPPLGWTAHDRRAAAAGTARPGATGTARPGATGTARPGATGTARPGATGTATPVAS